MILPPDSKPARLVPRAPKVVARPPRDIVDLHCHSTLSDGVHTVEELLDMAVARNLRALAITDHDNLDAYVLGKDAARERGIELVPGIEISAVHGGRDVHVLGYCFDPTNLRLNLELKEQQQRRRERIRAIMKKLAALGVELSFEKVLSFSKGGVLAHPLRTGVDDLLDKLPDWGLGGMEIVTGTQKGAAARKLREYALSRKFVCTGGSDYHNEQSPCGLGTLSIPYRALDELRDKLEIQKTEWT